MTNKRWKWVWIWAGLVCNAQMYVGKHFPSDIGAGALLGLIIGTAMSKIFEMAGDSKINTQPIMSFFS